MVSLQCVLKYCQDLTANIQLYQPELNIFRFLWLLYESPAFFKTIQARHWHYPVLHFKISPGACEKSRKTWENDVTVCQCLSIMPWHLQLQLPSKQGLVAWAASVLPSCYPVRSRYVCSSTWFWEQDALMAKPYLARCEMDHKPCPIIPNPSWLWVRKLQVCSWKQLYRKSLSLCRIILAFYTAFKRIYAILKRLESVPSCLRLAIAASSASAAKTFSVDMQMHELALVWCWGPQRRGRHQQIRLLVVQILLPGKPCSTSRYHQERKLLWSCDAVVLYVKRACGMYVEICQMRWIAAHRFLLSESLVAQGYTSGLVPRSPHRRPWQSRGTASVQRWLDLRCGQGQPCQP